eukprot:9498254-Pyramimonas_sp.AAC.1
MPQEQIGREKVITQSRVHIEHAMGLNDFGILRAVLGRAVLGRSRELMHVDSYIETSLAILHDLGGHSVPGAL